MIPLVGVSVDLNLFESDILVKCQRGLLVDVFSVNYGVFSEGKSDFSIKGVGEEIKQMILVDFTVCLLGRRHTFCKQKSQLTGFVMY
ncbi:hypothetical protein SAMN04487948_10245 [Halogranum amylolyticum]|uniref:Uncharacterized protein n=1 Tax=Halogranum amylolyticum TaxID=660520 RepID=A0A1H8P1R0_9EURY|nr:hypothetical protein SAMN04487948_10245 [Halogranum amylolyticum]